MGRQEDIDNSTFRYCNDCKKLGRNIDPNMVDDYKAGVEHGYKYVADRAWGLIEKLCDSHNIVSIKDGKYKSRSWLEEQFRKAMEE